MNLNGYRFNYTTHEFHALSNRNEFKLNHI